jgi:hypothetical protein
MEFPLIKDKRKDRKK